MFLFIIIILKSVFYKGECKSRYAIMEKKKKKDRKHVQYSLYLLGKQINIAYACNNKHSFPSLLS